MVNTKQLQRDVKHLQTDPMFTDESDYVETQRDNKGMQNNCKEK